MRWSEQTVNGLVRTLSVAPSSVDEDALRKDPAHGPQILGLSGHENSRQNPKLLRWTDFHAAVGRPPRVRPASEPVTGGDRQELAAERMAPMARLLPERYRGENVGRAAREPIHLEFLPSAAGQAQE